LESICRTIQASQGHLIPKFGRREAVDILIGQDYEELHLSLPRHLWKDSRGAHCETHEVRIENRKNEKGSNRQVTNFARTYFTHSQQDVMEEINQNLRKSWEVENYGLDREKVQVPKL
jgi:hypothetical protein